MLWVVGCSIAAGYFGGVGCSITVRHQEGI